MTGVSARTLRHTAYKLNLRVIEVRTNLPGVKAECKVCGHVFTVSYRSMKNGRGCTPCFRNREPTP
jgi:hypothetical protein